MGCDIHSVAIDDNGKIIENGDWQDGIKCDPEYGLGSGEPFGWRNYSVFGFLANVRNYSDVTSISEPRGLPNDLVLPEYEDGGEWLGDHSFSWLSVAELEAFNYDAPMEDKRIRVPTFFADGQPSGSTAGTAENGSGAAMTYREFLGDAFFKDVAELRRIGADRVAFGFDS